MKWQRIPRWLMSLAIGWILAFNLGAAVLPEPQEAGQIPSVLAENALTHDPESSRPASTENYVASGPLAQEMVAAHMRMTQADKDLELRLQDRRRQGEYILESEFPSQRMFHEVALNSHVQLSPEKSAELDQLLASLGLPPETRQQLQNHDTRKIQSLQNVRKQMDPAYLRARMEEEYRRMEMLLKSPHR